MKKSWVSGLDKDASEVMEGDYERALHLRKRLEEILIAKIKLADDLSTKKGSYDTPNWAYLQADLVGYKRALKEVIDLIS